MERSRRQRWRRSTKIFVVSFIMGLTGAIAFVTGLNAAFSQAGIWSDYLMEYGIVLLIAAGAGNFMAVLAGGFVLFRTRYLLWWWPVSILGVLGSIYGGLVALSL